MKRITDKKYSLINALLFIPAMLLVLPAILLVILIKILIFSFRNIIGIMTILLISTIIALILNMFYVGFN